MDLGRVDATLPGAFPPVSATIHMKSMRLRTLTVAHKDAAHIRSKRCGQRTPKAMPRTRHEHKRAGQQSTTKGAAGKSKHEMENWHCRAMEGQRAAGEGCRRRLGCRHPSCWFQNATTNNISLCNLAWTCVTQALRIHEALRQGRFHCCPDSQRKLMDFVHFPQAPPKDEGLI